MNREEDSQQICREFRQLFMQKNISDFSRREKREAANHLKDCDECNAFYKSIESISNALSYSDTLKPEPDIVQEHLKTRQSKSFLHGFFMNILYLTKHILDIRVPVYQIALLTVLVIGVRYSYDMYSNSQFDVSIEEESLRETAIYSLHITEYLDMVQNQQIGSNLKEDSTLTEMYVYAQ